MLPRNRRATLPPAESLTPYCQRLQSLLEIEELDCETTELVVAMTRSVGNGNYGRARTLYRLLPLAHRTQLGAPPADRDHDTHGHLAW